MRANIVGREFIIDEQPIAFIELNMDFFFINALARSCSLITKLVGAVAAKKFLVTAVVTGREGHATD